MKNLTCYYQFFDTVNIFKCAYLGFDALSQLNSLPTTVVALTTYLLRSTQNMLKQTLQ